MQICSTGKWWLCISFWRYAVPTAVQVGALEAWGLLCRYLASVDSPVTRALLALDPQHRHFYEAEQQAQYRLQHTAFCKAFWVR